MIDEITQNISPVTPLPGLLVENRPAAVNQLVEEELPLLSTQLETLVGQLNTTISQTNIAVDIAANAAVISNSLSNYVGEWNNLVTYDKNQTTSIGTLYYISKVDNNLNHIVTDTNYWLPNPVNTKIDYNMSRYTEKVTPVNTDLFPLSDSAATFGIKKLTWANIKATIISSFGVMISTLTAKTTPVDADIFIIGDSAATNASKKLTWADIKATLKTYFDTLYFALTGSQTVAGIKTFTSSPIVPTPSSADNSTKVATTEFVRQNIDTATVNLTVGAIGSYSLLLCTTVGQSITAGSLYSGSSLKHNGYQSVLSAGGSVAAVTVPSTTITGTWRAMGNATVTSGSYANTLFLRIS